MRLQKAAILVIALLCFGSANGQKKDLKYNFYGFVRGDLFYNSRANVESFDGLFQLFPYGKEPDANGKDLNAVPHDGFYMMITRFGLDLQGPKILGAESSAKVEADFAGFSGSHTMIRIRHANIKLKWDGGSSLLVGQSWHPLFGDVMPKVLNVSTGAPFQPFSRTPQINYQYSFGKLSLAAMALFQYQFTSTGPDGKSAKYSKNAIIPELFAGANYRDENLLLSAGVDVLSIKPRTRSIVADKTYKVDEMITTASFMVGGTYTKNLLYVAAKSVYGRNLSNVTMLGGYGVSSIDPIDGRCEYTPFKNLSSWLNVTYGKKYQGGFFVGHAKNFGTTKSLVAKDKIYGQGLDIDNLVNVSGQFSYNIPSLTVGLEYAISSARYGDLSLEKGTIYNSYRVNNHRVVAVVTYFF